MAFEPVFINGIKTPKGRVSYPFLDKPDMTGQFATKKYKASLLIPKESDISILRNAVIKCAKETWGDEIKSMKDFQSPFQDGDKKKGDESNGCVVITGKNKKRPLLVGPGRGDLEPDDVYGGCYARFAVTVYSYEGSETVKQPDGSKTTELVRGVTLLLDGVQKIEDGESFGGGGITAAAFDDGEIDVGEEETFVTGDGFGDETAGKDEVDDLF